MIFTPIFPNWEGLMLEAPTTRVARITGMTIILSRFTSKDPNGFIQPTPGPKRIPTTAPAIKPIRIRIRRLDLKY